MVSGALAQFLVLVSVTLLQPLIHSNGFASSASVADHLAPTFPKSVLSEDKTMGPSGFVSEENPIAPPALERRTFGIFKAMFNGAPTGTPAVTDPKAQLPVDPKAPKPDSGKKSTTAPSKGETPVPSKENKKPDGAVDGDVPPTSSGEGGKVSPVDPSAASSKDSTVPPAGADEDPTKSAKAKTPEVTSGGGGGTPDPKTPSKPSPKSSPTGKDVPPKKGL